MNETCELSGFIQSAVHKYIKTVAKVAFSYLKNTAEAEDITQEVFLALVQKQPEFDNEEHLKAWLIRVVVNKCKNHLKSSWFSKREAIQEELSYMPKEQSEVLLAVLALEVKYRIPIHLYYYEGYSIKEIAEILGERPATIGTQLSRGRDILKNMIGGILYE
jgi:RNA polymerase sigma-70 factor (ECF subfamily)